MQSTSDAPEVPAVRIGRPAFSLSEIRNKDVLSSLMHKVGHEIGNPLTSIISLATVIERFLQPDGPGGGMLEPQRITAYAGSIINESWRISSTVEKLVLLFSQRSGNPCACNVGTVVQKALNKIRSRQKVDTGIVRFRVLSDEPPSALIDIDQFVSLISELLENAYQSLGPAARLADDGSESETGADRPEITVEAASENGRTIVAVHSCSSQRCPFELDELFEPLVTSFVEQKRIGLGLTAAYAITDRANGTIEVEERAEDGRFRFSTRLSLPNAAASLKKTPEQELQPAKKPEKPASGASDCASLPAALLVCIVEDEQHVASGITKLLAAALERKTKLSTRVLSGEAAIEMLKNGDPFDLMLCDLNLAGISGRFVYETLLNERPAARDRFIFVTGERSRPETQLYLQTSGRAYLHKPFSPEELFTVVVRSLGLS